MICKACMQPKAAADFYVSNHTRCKECIKASTRANRAERLEQYRAYDRMRGSQAHRVAARQEYQKTANFAESHRAAAKRWQSRHPDRRAANILLDNAVRDRRVIPWPVCAVPECSGKPQGHHPDYSRPLDVVWLCTTHHQAAHAIARTASPASPNGMRHGEGV